MSSSTASLRKLEAELQTDLVLSERQVFMQLGSGRAQSIPPQWCAFELVIAPSRHSRTFTRQRFYTLESCVKDLHPNVIRHLVGVAQMRRLLNAPSEAWTVEGGGDDRPDARWQTDTGVIAVEFDAGSYSPQQITRKAFSFRHYDKQVWGSSSWRRTERLRPLLAEFENAAEPLYAAW